MVRIPARPIDAALIILCVDRVERCCIGRHLNRDKQVARDKTLDRKSSAPRVLVLRYATRLSSHFVFAATDTPGAVPTSAKTRAAFRAHARMTS